MPRIRRSQPRGMRSPKTPNFHQRAPYLRPRKPGIGNRNMAANMNAQARAQAQRERQMQAQHVTAPTLQAPPVQANSNQPPAGPAQLADPRDSRYYMELAAGQAGAQNQLAQLTAASKSEKAALGERLRLLAEQEPIERQNATNQFNLQGLLYSGALGRAQGDIGLDFLRERTGAQRAFDDAEAQRRLEIDAINRAWGDGGTELWRLLQEAVERSSERDMTAPLAPPAVPKVKKKGPGRPRSTGARPSPTVQRIRARASRYEAKGNTRAAATLRKRARKLAKKGK